MNLSPHKNKWEQGSEFHLFRDKRFFSSREYKSKDKSIIYAGSGRDAIRLIFRRGRKVYRWKRAFIPSYLCPEVIRAIKEEISEFEIYYDDPREVLNPPVPNSQELLFLVNTFGLRPKWHINIDVKGQIIEDHTHDPWSSWARESTADYCFASLRKTLPIPDGAIIWSPKGLPLPPQPKLTAQHHLAASLKLNAMIIKAYYLDGLIDGKHQYLDLFREGEDRISGKMVSDLLPISKSILKYFDVKKWRSKRLNNYIFMLNALENNDSFDILKPLGKGACPFSFIAVFDNNAVREKVRKNLISSNIYSAVLWRIDTASKKMSRKNRDLSERMLSIHCDGRYSMNDLSKVLDVIKNTLRGI